MYQIEEYLDPSRNEYPLTEHSNGVKLLAKIPKKKRKEGSKEATHVQEKKESGKEDKKEAVQESKLKNWENTERSRNQP